MRRESFPPGLMSVLISTTVFSLGLAIGLHDGALLAVWPGVFVLAGMQHLFIVAPVYLIMTRIWRPLSQSSLWSFGLWGAGLAAMPWALLVLIDEANKGFAHWRDYSGFLGLVALSGIAGGLAFGKLIKKPVWISLRPDDH